MPPFAMGIGSYGQMVNIFLFSCRRACETVENIKAGCEDELGYKLELVVDIQTANGPHGKRGLKGKGERWLNLK